MNLIGLRITGPRTREQYLNERANPRPLGPDTSVGEWVFPTDEEDLAEAYRLAFEAVQTGHGRFDAVFIAGDEAERVHNLSKAQRLLGWTPRSQRLTEGA